MNPANIAEAFAVGFIPFLFALCVHEYSHGWVASKLGDPTARLMGRLTLNPLAHADPLGTFILPLIGMFTGFPVIGWAKPVPVNARNLKNERTGMFWVALAGPTSNMIMAMIGAFTIAGIYKFMHDHALAHTLTKMAGGFVTINLWLALFNLIPLNPLDGGKIFAIFLPESFNRRLDENQVITGFLLLVLFMTGALGTVLAPAAEFLFRGMIGIAANVMGV